MSICQLCKKEKKLIKDHIIPEFMFKNLFDDTHSMKLMINDDTKIYNKFTGIFDKNILCKECDNQIIGQYEDYVKRILYGGTLNNQNYPEVIDQKYSNGVCNRLIKNLDYKKFKLFLLTILWKASITKQDFFRNVNLGEHEQIIREMIITGNPKEPLDYPCFIYTYRFQVPQLGPITSEPIQFNLKKNSCYQFLIDGFFYRYFITNELIDDFIKEAVINKSNELRIYYTPNDNPEHILKNYIGLKI